MTMARLPGPSETNLRLLQAIHAYIAEHHFAPSLRDLMPLFHIRSTSAMNYRLRAIQDAGYITRVPTIARSITITAKGEEVLAAPKAPFAVVYGRVNTDEQLGKPIKRRPSH